MAFIRIRTINGKQYRYLEERYRLGTKVKSRSKYLGRVIALLTPIPPEQQGARYIERLMEKYPTPPAVDVVKTISTAPAPVEKATSAPSASSASPDPQGEQSANVAEGTEPSP